MTDKSPKAAPASPKLAPGSPKKRPAADPVGPPEKKVKTDAGAVGVKKKGDPATVRKQVEYYFSDENLKRDKFFHEKIASDKDGWLDMQLILSCNKIRQLNIEASDVLSALAESPLKTKQEGDKVFVRRTQALPALDERAQNLRQAQNEKKKAHAHDGGVLIQVSEIPEEITWAPIKQKLREVMPEGAKVMFATNVSEKNTCTVLFGPFEGDVAFIEALKLEVDKVALKVTIVHGALLQECLKLLPKHIQKRREAQGKNRTKQRQKPVLLAGQKFANVATVRAKIKEIIMARKDGQAMVDGSPDTLLVKAVIAYHPRGAEKTQGLVSLKVDSSGHTSTSGKPSRCFFMVKADGVAEDISMMKCFNEMERKLSEEKEEKPKTNGSSPKAADGSKSPKLAPSSPKLAAAKSPKLAPSSPKAKPSSPKAAA